MNKKDARKLINVAERSVVILIFFLLLIFESIYTIATFFIKGVYKKETLSRNSKLGFNFKIIMKS